MLAKNAHQANLAQNREHRFAPTASRVRQVHLCDPLDVRIAFLALFLGLQQRSVPAAMRALFLGMKQRFAPAALRTHKVPSWQVSATATPVNALFN
jgi:hypothetical protein